MWDVRSILLLQKMFYMADPYVYQDHRLPAGRQGEHFL